MSDRKKILVVDDERMLLDAVSSYLESKGFQVLTAENGTEAMNLFRSHSFSFLILDLMLPDISGEEICEEIRKFSRIPILMLTAKAQEESLLNGFSLGADDYLTKPFSLKELYARIQAILRRSGEGPEPLASRFSWNDNDLCIDFELKKASRKGASVSLTPSEWKLLSALVKYPQRVFTRDDLISIVFGDDFDSYDRVIDTHIKNLRKKIEDDPRNPVYVRTVHGIGYRFGGEDR